MIFDEKSTAENILSNGFSSFMSGREINILARYFKYIGQNKNQIRINLVEFCKKNNPEFNDVLSRDRINYAVRQSQKNGIRLKMDITITSKEMDAIKSIQDYNEQKVLFVMLAVSKYMKYSGVRYIPKKESPYENDFYINEKTTSILKMAKVNVNKATRSKIFSNLNKIGMIEATYNGGFRILIVDENFPSSVLITNMDNMIDFFPLKNMIKCSRCGEMIEKTGKRQKYCHKCYQENDIENSKYRHRNANKS